MNLFRKAKPMTVEDSGSKDQRFVIRKLSAAVRILLKVTKESKFRIAENSSGRAQSICFELPEYPDYVLRARGNELYGEKSSRSKDFVLDSSFYIMPDLWHKGFVSFESVHKAAHYIRLTDNGLLLDRYDGTSLFKEEASFLMGKASKQANMKRVTKWIQSVTCNEKGSEVRRNVNRELPDKKCNGYVGGETFSNLIHISEDHDLDANDLTSDARILFENTHCQSFEKEDDFKNKSVNREQHVTFETVAEPSTGRKKINCSLDSKLQRNSILKNKQQSQRGHCNCEKEEGTLNGGSQDRESSTSNSASQVAFQLDQLCDEGCYLVEGNADHDDLSGQQYFNGPDGFVFKFITVDSDNFIRTKDDVGGSPARKAKNKLRKEGVCYQNMSLQEET